MIYTIVAVWNVIVILIFGFDKLCAKKKKRRVSEKFLIMSALCMGALGALLGMLLFNHKTKKPKFKFGVPALLLLNIAFVALYFRFF